MQPKFKIHPIAGDGESEPNVAALYFIIAAMLSMLLCAIVPFVWQAWSVKP